MVKLAGAPDDATTSATLVNTRDLTRTRLARKIDATAARVAKPKILSVGSGRLRELSLSMAFSQLRIGTFAVIEPDRSALAQVALEHGNVPGLVLIGGTVRDVLTGTLALARFDLIYTVGLYDQLPRVVASALTAMLVKALSPGGELLIGNAAKTYELCELCSIVPCDELTSMETYVDETGAYLELVRA